MIRMDLTIGVALTLINLFWLFTIPFGLPGTWFMILFAVGVDWFRVEQPLIGAPILIFTALLALAAEVAEFMLGAAGARSAGGSVLATVLAVVGGIIGAVLGIGIPIPLIGSLVGACLGAFAGSIVGEMINGKTLQQSLEAGRGAAVGRFWGTVVKMIVGTAILLTIAVAVLMG